MTSNKNDIERDIEHQREILAALRDRLRVLELKEARLGISVDPAIVTEIRELTERIQRHDAELTRLRIEAAIDKEPLAEVEYRALLAAMWDTPSGQPTVAGASRLAFDRLRLGVIPTRAEELEKEIRSALVTESFKKIPNEMLKEGESTFSFELSRSVHYTIRFDTLKIFTFVNADEASAADRRVIDTLQLIGRCIRLDLEATVGMFIAMFPEGLPHITSFERNKTRDLGEIVISISSSSDSKSRFFHRDEQFPSQRVFNNGFARLLKDINNVRSDEEKVLFMEFLKEVQLRLTSSSAIEMLRKRVAEFEASLTIDGQQ